jgi:glutamine---fructose-6-phosphate transaminase (isomerizing)
MCGIVAILSRPASRVPALPSEVLALLDEAVALAGRPGELVSALLDAAAATECSDVLLRGVPGVLTLVRSPGLEAAVLERLDALDHRADTVESVVEQGDVADLERANAALERLRDAVWAIRKDRLRCAREVGALAGRDAGDAAVAAMFAVQAALSALDRLEVRGRDSAGIHLLVTGHGLDLTGEPVRQVVAERSADPLFTSGSVRVADGALSFVYKAAAEIGELGDNTRALRAGVREDVLLHLALRSPDARIAVLAHTRWASVGIISEANAHPLNQEEDGVSGGPYVVAALNGDVDNHADLKAEHGLRIPSLITTDAKVIPALVSRAAATAPDLTESFRRTVASFDGSVAIAAASAREPSRVWLALRGSGQALYVGLAEDLTIVASEPYGVVEEAGRFLRMDGETPAVEGQPASRGQIVVLDAERAGEVGGIHRLAYDGTDLPVVTADLATAAVTTRDIDRGDFPHFLLKEISEAPASFHKTLRGRIVSGDDGHLRAVLGDLALPPALVLRLRAGAIGRIVVLGQGTAAVAGQSMAELLAGLLDGSGVQVMATTATEFSGFGMRQDLTDTLVVAVSQSGTTTDTNRTVDLARGRGATVVAIVNRRGSDLTDKADGVLYTSDGRDVEMSVASTKAFYAQVAAGVLLACALTDTMGIGTDDRRHELLSGLREVPDAMRAVLERRPAIAEAARRFAPSRRYWAIVGNGPNKVAAEEIRIKLSELCYKSIACDVTEDKKHIDLSSEPLIFVCAAGLRGSTVDDVAKEVAIYRAHKAAPIVVADEDEDRFQAALQVIAVPVVAPELAFVLSTVVGHLFGYEAALAIDALARPLREAREAVEVAALAGTDDVVAGLQAAVGPALQRFDDQLRAGQYDGHLEAGTAVRLALLLRHAVAPAPLDAYQAEHGKVATPTVFVDDLVAALTRAIDELTRPIDAIKHQAKTVTVGISRSDEGLLTAPLVRAALEAGAPRDRLTYRTLKSLAALSPAVVGTVGFTRYRIDGDPAGAATIEIVDRGGLGRDVASRVERNPELRGSKRRVAIEREAVVARGRSDGRTVVFVPEVKGALCTGITLLHVRLAERLPALAAQAVLQGYRDRYAVLCDAVTETEPVFRDDLLASIDVADLLTLPVADLADRWRSA